MLGRSSLWNLKPAGKGIINVGNTLDRSCRSDKEKDGTHSSKRNTERPREKVNGQQQAGQKEPTLSYKHGQQAGRTKRTQIGLQTRAAGREGTKNPNWVTNKGSRQGGHKEPKLSSKGSSQGGFIF